LRNDILAADQEVSSLTRGRYLYALGSLPTCPQSTKNWHWEFSFWKGYNWIRYVDVSICSL